MELLSLDLHGHCLRSSDNAALVLSLYLVLTCNGDRMNSVVDALSLGVVPRAVILTLSI